MFKISIRNCFWHGKHSSCWFILWWQHQTARYEWAQSIVSQCKLRRRVVWSVSPVVACNTLVWFSSTSPIIEHITPHQDDKSPAWDSTVIAGIGSTAWLCPASLTPPSLLVVTHMIRISRPTTGYYIVKEFTNCSHAHKHYSVGMHDIYRTNELSAR